MEQAREMIFNIGIERQEPLWVHHGPATVRRVKVKPPGSLRVFCFGEFEVYTGAHVQRPVGWRTSKAKELLAYFIHQRQPKPRQEVVAALWPEVPPEQAATFLHTHLYFLRQILQGSGKNRGVVFENGKYRLVAGELFCDALIFEELIRRLDARGRGEDSEKTLIMLEQAAALYQGDYLGYEDWEWSQARRDEYSRKYLHLLQRIVAYYFKQNNYRPAIDYLEKIIAANPLLEEGRQMMMQAHAALGDRLGVIRQYHSLRDILMKELGLEPARETSKLFYELLGEP